MEKSDTAVISTLGHELTKKLQECLEGALKEGLEALNQATRSEPKHPHGYDAFIEWLRLDGKNEILQHVAFRINTVLLKKEGDAWRDIPSYCENQGFDIPTNIKSEDLLDVLHDTMLHILVHFHQTSMRIQSKDLE